MSPRASTAVQVEPVPDAAVQFAGTTLVAFTKTAMWAINDENFTQRPKAHSAELECDIELADEIRAHGGAFWRGTKTGSFSINLKMTAEHEVAGDVETGLIEAAFLIVIGSLQ